MSDLRLAPPVPWIPIVVAVTLVQAVLAAMTRMLPLFGMPLTAAADMPPEAVGQLSSATGFGSMVFFLWGPILLARLPSIRQLQAGCVVSAVAMLFSATGHWEGVLLAAFVIGLGYGPSATAASDLLMRITPQGRRAMIFSIKQAGVPLGGFVAGLTLPVIAAAWGGFPAAAVVVALAALLAAVALGLWRGQVEEAVQRVPTPPLRDLVLAPIRLIALLARAPQMRLIIFTGFCLGIAQGVVMGFYPVFLSDHAGWSLTAAGAAFALLQGVGVGGRVLMGWFTDKLGDTVRALAGLCFLSGVTMMLVATIGPSSSLIWVGLLSALAGLIVVSWNGVFMAGIAEAAPEGRVGEVTAAGTFVVFSGYVLCPLLMMVVFSATEGYALGWILAGLAPMTAGAALIIGVKPNRKR